MSVIFIACPSQGQYSYAEKTLKKGGNILIFLKTHLCKCFGYYMVQW